MEDREARDSPDHPRGRHAVRFHTAITAAPWASRRAGLCLAWRISRWRMRQAGHERQPGAPSLAFWPSTWPSTRAVAERQLAA